MNTRNLTLGSFVKIDPSGVHIVGPEIGLNEGGSAGTGNGYVAKTPLLPNEIEAITAPDELEYIEVVAQLVTADALVTLANCDIPLAKMCERVEGGECTLSEEGA